MAHHESTSPRAASHDMPLLAMQRARPVFVTQFTGPRERIVSTLAATECHIMLLVTTGCYHWQGNGGECQARVGDVVLHRAGSPRIEWNEADSPPTLLVVHFRWRDLPDSAPSILHDRFGRMRLMAEWLHEGWWQGQHVAQEEGTGLFLGMLGEWHRLQTTVDDELVRRVRCFVVEHMEEPLRLADLARHVCLSVPHLIRRYKALTGTTPAADMRRIRLEYARSLVMTTNLPMKAIASRVGMADEFSLSHGFKAHFGHPPTALRR